MSIVTEETSSTNGHDVATPGASTRSKPPWLDYEVTDGQTGGTSSMHQGRRVTLREVTWPHHRQHDAEPQD